TTWSATSTASGGSPRGRVAACSVRSRARRAGSGCSVDPGRQRHPMQASSAAPPRASGTPSVTTAPRSDTTIPRPRRLPGLIPERERADARLGGRPFGRIEGVTPQVPKHEIILAPGPTPIPPEVLNAQAQPLLYHRGPGFGQLMRDVGGRLQELYRTEDEVLL